MEQGHRDEETTALLARTYKDLWLQSADAVDRRQYLDAAHREYLQAYETSAGYWSGINAATTALLLDDRGTSAALARRVHDQCVTLLETDTSPAGRYWLLATLGEAALLVDPGTTESLDLAEGWYRQAAALKRGIGDVASTRRNARLILGHLGVSTARIDACFAVRPVVVFAGHLIDSPARPSPRFPPALEGAVRDAIRQRVAGIAPAIGYAAAGCGGDILFLEALQDAGVETHVVLPFERESFRAHSVDVAPGGDWNARFDRVLARAADVVVASDQKIGSGGMSYTYGFRMLDGMACIKADELDAELVGLALWDGQPGDGLGGTAEAVGHWTVQNRRVEIVDLATVSGWPHATAPATERGVPPAAESGEPRIVGLLFADFRGFSTLPDQEIPLFIESVLGMVGQELANAPSPPLFANTWGDGLYLVFDSVEATGGFALRLRDRTVATNWRAKGFSRDLGLRIGIHAGPAYPCVDPVTGRANFFGAHVSRAARIEPITPPGEVYASSAFASLARSDDVGSFRYAYVGRTPLAKGYGSFPMYVLQRRSGL